MDFSFENKEIRTLCEDMDKAQAQYGHAVAQDLQSRLADLDAATTVNEIMTGRPGKADNSPLGNYKVDLCDGFRLVFCSNHIDPPLANDDIDWGKVTRIRILKIENINE